MTEPRHTYPSRHPKGSYWATDIAWEILDQLKPGVIPEHVRAYLAGAIGGALSRVAEENNHKRERER